VKSLILWSGLTADVVLLWHAAHNASCHRRLRGAGGFTTGNAQLMPHELALPIDQNAERDDFGPGTSGADGTGRFGVAQHPGLGIDEQRLQQLLDRRLTARRGW
jgi:hypothetical protein